MPVFKFDSQKIKEDVKIKNLRDNPAPGEYEPKFDNYQKGQRFAEAKRVDYEKFN